MLILNYLFNISAIPSTTLMLSTTNTTITMTWSLSFAPSTYKGYQQCRRQCEQILGPVISHDSILSPHTLTGINPGSYCIVTLDGQYGIHQRQLATGNATTLSAGKIECN